MVRSGLLNNAQAVILALDTDSATLFATVMLQDIAPRVPIYARVNHVDNLDRIHNAGAQFAQALGEVSSHILAERMIGTKRLRLSAELEVFQVDAQAFVGRHPKGLGIRERTGCSVVAIERDGEVLARFGSEFEIEEGDQMTLCGSTEAAQSFREALKESSTWA